MEERKRRVGQELNSIN